MIQNRHKLLIGLGVLVLLSVAITAPSISQETTQEAEIEEEFTLTDREWGAQTVTLTYTTDSIPENVTTELQFEQVGVDTEILSVNQEGLLTNDLLVTGTTTNETIRVTLQFTFQGVDEADNFLSTKGILLRNPAPDIEYYSDGVVYQSDQNSPTRTRSVTTSQDIKTYTADSAEFTRHFIYIGVEGSSDVTVRNFSVDGTTVTLYTPDYSTTNVSESDVEWVETIFSHTQQTLNTDNVDTDHIQIATSPRVVRNGGQTWNRLDSDVYVWANEEQFTDPSEPLVAHELLHTYQKHRVTDNMEWWIEGSATYMSGMYTLSSSEDPNEEYVSSQVFSDMWYERNEIQNSSSVNMSAKNPESWEGSFEYTRPPRIVFLIDVAVREHTDGEKTIIDVFNWMNEQDTPVRYSAFRAYIVSQTDPKFGERLDRYVTTTEEINYKQEAEEINGENVSEPFVLPVKSEQPLEEPYEEDHSLDNDATGSEVDPDSNDSDPNSGGISSHI